MEQVAFADPENPGKLLVVACHEPRFGCLLADLWKPQGGVNYVVRNPYKHIVMPLVG